MGLFTPNKSSYFRYSSPGVSAHLGLVKTVDLSTECGDLKIRITAEPPCNRTRLLLKKLASSVLSRAKPRWGRDRYQQPLDLSAVVSVCSSLGSSSVQVRRR